MSASQQVFSQTPLRLLANGILNKFFRLSYAETTGQLDIVSDSPLLKVHQSIKQAFEKNQANAEEYECIWQSVKTKLISIEFITPEEIENSFVQLQTHVAKQDEFFIKIVQFYKTFLKLCYWLHQISRLGMPLDSLERENDRLIREANDKHREAERNGVAVLNNLENMLQRIKANKADLIDRNAMVTKLYGLLDEGYKNFTKRLNEDYDSFYGIFEAHQNSQKALHDSISQFNADVRSEKANQAALSSIEANINALRNKFSALTTVTESTIRDDAQAIALIETAINDFKTQAANKEEELNNKRAKLLKEEADLQTDLNFLQTNKNGTAQTLADYIKRQQSISLKDQIPFVAFDINTLTDIKEADTIYNRVQGYCTSLEAAVNNVSNAQLKIFNFKENLYSTRKIHLQNILSDIQKHKFLLQTYKEFKEAAKELGSLAKSNYFKGFFKFNFELKAWELSGLVDDLANISEKEIIDTQSMVTGHVQQTLYELEKLDSYLKEQNQEYEFNKKKYLETKETFSKILKVYLELREKVVTAAKQHLEQIREQDANSFAKVQQQALFALGKLHDEILAYKPEKISIVGTPIQIYDRKALTKLERQLVSLKETHRANGSALQMALKQQPSQQRVAEIAVVAPKPSLFRRHWLKLSSGVVLGAGIGAGIGFAVGAFTTIGLASALTAAIGAAIGAAVGLVSGIIIACVKREAPPKPQTLSHSTNRIHQEIGRPKVSPRTEVRLEREEIQENIASPIPEFRAAPNPSPTTRRRFP